MLECQNTRVKLSWLIVKDENVIFCMLNEVSVRFKRHDVVVFMGR